MTNFLQIISEKKKTIEFEERERERERERTRKQIVSSSLIQCIYVLMSHSITI